MLQATTSNIIPQIFSNERRKFQGIPNLAKGNGWIACQPGGEKPERGYPERKFSREVGSKERFGATGSALTFTQTSQPTDYLLEKIKTKPMNALVKNSPKERLARDQIGFPVIVPTSRLSVKLYPKGLDKDWIKPGALESQIPLSRRCRRLASSPSS